MKAANDNQTDELIKRTREIWQPRLGRELSRDEAGRLAANVAGYFSILAEWSRSELSVPVNDNCGGATTDETGARRDR